MFTKDKLRFKRKFRVRKKVSGTSDCPRLSVFRSNKSIYVQAIDDIGKTTIAFSSDNEIKKGVKVDKAGEVGGLLGKKLIDMKIQRAVFDRNGYKFHGRIKALADGVRAVGIQF